MKIKSKKALITIGVVILGFTGAILLLNNWDKGFFAANQNNTASISSMIETYTTDKRDVKLTIGVLKADEINYKLYGYNGKELTPVEYEYEIGSISKTFTASMLSKAIADGHINLNDSISKYLSLESNTFYPDILSLATHTSGYGEYPFDSSTLSDEELNMVNENFYEKKQNIYQGINAADILEDIQLHVLKEESYGWEYSNFGYAVLGTVLGDVYSTTFKSLSENYIKNDLGLMKTRLGNGTGDMNSYWAWNDDDTYFAAAGIVSTVTDLLKYGEMHLNDSPNYLALSHEVYETFEDDGISMGLGWIIDPESGYIWHNGGTSSYTSFLGIDKEHKTVVVILSNYPEKDDTKDDGAVDILGYTLLNSLGNEDRNVFNVLE
ncbi:MAG: serine hydrolase domain-containing protein [Anaerotignaceae bacterium]